MNWIGIITTLLTVVNILICLLLIFVVLLQRPKTEGLGAAFGGDTASNIFGAQTSNVLANLTRWLGGLFLGLCLVIAILGTIDPTRKSAVADYVNQKEAEKKAEAERLKAEQAAKDAESQLPGAQAPGGPDLDKTPVEATPPVQPVPPDAKPPIPPEAAPGATAPSLPPSVPPSPVDAPKPPDAAAPTTTPQPAPEKPVDSKPADAPQPAPAAEPAPAPDAPKPQ